MGKYVIGIDAGTMGVRCVIFDLSGNEISSAYFETPTVYPKPGWVEQDANDIVDLAYKSVAKAIEKKNIDASEIASISFTNQRTSWVPIDKDGNFLYNMILWQDQRGAEIIPWAREQLAKHGMTELDLYKRCGHPLGSVQYGTSAFWFRLNEPALYEKTYKMISPQALLTKAFGADDWYDEEDDANWWLVTNGDTFEFDPELCNIFGMDIDKYPRNMKSGTPIGGVTEEVAKKTGLKVGTPIFVGSGDQQCGAAGVGNSGAAGLGSVCLGTAGLCIGYSSTPVRDANGKCHVLGHPAGGYTMEGHASAAASSFRWCRNAISQYEMVTEEVSGIDVYTIMSSIAGKAPLGAKGTIFLPWLAGAACPYYNDSARGAFVGMTLGTTKSELLRAAMEGICFEMRGMLEALNEAGFKDFDKLRITGGAARSDLWNQIQADIYGCSVETVKAPEATALGAAMIGAVGAGIFKDLREASEAMVSVKRTYDPIAKNVELYNEVYEVFKACYRGLAQEGFNQITDYQNKYC
ncbi:MAG: xylulose kinase [Lachnospiraceae bacterium]|nr:xylulose kinase [Lachnospiraceae bacterium]